ncbi:hypothetical protein V5O48_009047 [Marasmius crinis-equi]|uniref:Zinc finger PHD-type domain-containing protein n=1 Tax=Marasmius crinis-equi TaxID=585013 RepID=A0ABR3FC79_9AGAR
MPRGYDGYYTTSVVYKLAGGSKAQEWFWTRQRDHLKSTLGLVLSPMYPQEFASQPILENPDFSKLPIKDMLWLASKPKSLPHLEYAKHDTLGKPLTHSKRPNPVINLEYDSEPVSSVSETQSLDDFFLEAAESRDSRNTPEGFDSDSFADLSNDAPKVSVPPPSITSVILNCRCGNTGNDSSQYTLGDLIKCMGCKQYSHAACMSHDEASRKGGFICEDCLGPSLLKEALNLNTQAVEPRAEVKDRLRCGQMVLAKDGPLFHYPCRLIRRTSEGLRSPWTVQWYRGNQVHETAAHTPGTSQNIPVSRLVDSLWGDVKGRRGVRLGRWTTTAELSSMEETAKDLKYQIIRDPKKSVTHTALVDSVLQPHKPVFERLIFDRPALNHHDLPVLNYMKTQRTSVVPFDGGFPLETQSQVINWLYTNIHGIQDIAATWIVDGTLQHGLTLLIQDSHGREFEAERFCPRNTVEKKRYVLQRSWTKLLEWTPDTQEKVKRWVDVDREALAILERKMFDRSRSAGQAGNCQWGLDAGIHQNGWFPYFQFRDWEVDQDRDDEAELERGRRFDQDPYTVKWKKDEEERKRQEKEQEKRNSSLRPKPKPAFKSSKPQ